MAPFEGIKRNIQITSVLMILYMVVSILRSPDTLLVGRFYAEEGAVFWSRARANNFWDTITFNPNIGYFQLSTNLHAQALSYLPVRIAPLISAWISLILSAVSAILIVLAPNRLCTSLVQRFIIAAVLLFSAPVTEPDIFANSIQLQVHLGLLSIVIYFLDWDKITTRFSWLFIFPTLLLIGLSSIHPLVPLIAYIILFVSRFVSNSRVLRKRFFDSLGVATLGLTIASATQLAVFINSRQVENGMNIHPKIRGHSFAVSDLGIFLLSNMTTIFVGREQSDHIFERLQPNVFFGFVILMLFIAISIFIIGRQHSRDNPKSVVKISLLTLYFLFSLESMVGHLSPIPSARYQVIPSAILILFLFSLVFGIQRSKFRLFFASAFGIPLLLSSIGGLSDDPWNVLRCVDPCVTWPVQIDEAVSGERFDFRFWPYSSQPAFQAPVSPPEGFCKDFNALVQFTCADPIIE
jgi:hypothetical protein